MDASALSVTRPGAPWGARRTLRYLLARSGREWRLSPRAVLGVVALPFAVAAAGVLTALAGKEVYKWFTGEDRFAENLQVAAFALAAVLSLGVARRLARAGGDRLALLYLFAGVALLFVTGEEVSWGQRLFGWETPEALEGINRQEETTLHNVYGVETIFDVAQLLVGAAGTLLPLALLRSPALAARRRALSFVVPPVALVPFFLLPFVWRAYRDFGPAPTRHRFAVAEFAEVTELVLALGILLFFVFQARRLVAGRALLPAAGALGHAGPDAVRRALRRRGVAGPWERTDGGTVALRVPTAALGRATVVLARTGMVETGGDPARRRFAGYDRDAGRWWRLELSAADGGRAAAERLLAWPLVRLARALSGRGLVVATRGTDRAATTALAARLVQGAPLRAGRVPAGRRGGRSMLLRYHRLRGRLVVCDPAPERAAATTVGRAGRWLVGGGAEPDLVVGPDAGTAGGADAGRAR